MTPRAFLEALAPQVGGAIDSEEEQAKGLSISAHQPRLYGQLRGFHVKVDFIIREELLLEVLRPPPQRLLLREKGLFEKALGMVGLCPSIATGHPELDGPYVVQNLTEGQEGVLLTPAFLERLLALRPFTEFELGGHEYRLLKFVDIDGGYTPDQALVDMGRLLELVAFTDRLPPGPGAVVTADGRPAPPEP